MKRQTERFGLAPEKFAANTVHDDAVVGFGDGGEQGEDSEMFLLEQRVQRHGAVFAAAPAEEDGFKHFHRDQLTNVTCSLRWKMETNASQEIQAQRRKSEGVFVFLVGEIVELGVNLETARKLIGESCVSQHVARVAEQALKAALAGEGAVIGFDVECGAADEGVGVEREAAMTPGDVVSGRIAGPAEEGLPNFERRPN